MRTIKYIIIALLITSPVYGQSSPDTSDNRLLALIDSLKSTSYDRGFDAGFNVAIECVTVLTLQSKYGGGTKTIHEINEYCYKRFGVDNEN